MAKSVVPLVALFWFSILSDVAAATGFEKNGLFGARSAALAGTGVTMTGADALYFNPAGLATRMPGQQLASHLSASSVGARAPINNNNDTESSIQSISPVGGILYNKTIDDHWAVGAGVYGLAGGAIKYNPITFDGYAGGPLPNYSDLQVAELAIGAAYRVTPAFSAGVAIRYDLFEFSQAQPSRQYSGLALAAPEFSKLKGTDSRGFKIGVQYQMKESIRFGVSYRSSTTADLRGQMTGGKIESPFLSANLTAGQAAITMTVPQALTTGGSFRLDPVWTLHTEYSWTNYSKIENLTMVTDNTLVGSQTIPQNWKDLHTLRLACEYRGSVRPWRFGYAYSSAVTDSLLPNAAAAPPAPTHALSLGSALNWTVGKSPATLEFAIDYAASSGSGGTAEAGTTASDARKGTYSLAVLTLHTSFRFAF